jgi:O-succinylbenzoate synthase
LKFKFEIYQRYFKQPLRTSHGTWQIREGIIITLENSTGVSSKGEIAPLPWFGSETLSEALNFCQQLGEEVSLEDILAISDRLPACQFAFESAWLGLSGSSSEDDFSDLNYCYLLPAGEKALSAWQEITQQQSATTFKWKIGVYPLEEEIEILKQLVDSFSGIVKLRLDANGGLDLSQAEKLLCVTDTLEAIAFVEQPLKSDRFTDMMQLTQAHNTLLALDESVASYTQLQAAYERGWRGVYVIKAAIMGFPTKLKKFCRADIDIVFSSVFETEVGRKAVLKLARELNHPRAVGFGIESFY